jgi:hypothetical protein
LRPIIILKLKNKKMKKVFALLLTAGVLGLVACGPSAEEIAKAEQATKDSLALVEQQRLADSTAAADAAAAQAATDSIAKAEMDGKMQAMMDSMNAIKGTADKAIADAKAANAKAAAAKAAADKAKQQQPSTTVKAGQGKG